MSDKPKKALKPVVASQAMIDAVKRISSGSGTNEDNALVANASDAQRRAARKAAGVSKRGGGGFRSTVDIWIQRSNADGSKGEAALAKKFGWQEFGAIKKEVREKGARIRMMVVPKGVSPK